jgi:ribosomal protein S18 acetylase RimI-like enzyme
MIIRAYQESDAEPLVSLIADFRVALARFKAVTRVPDREGARKELGDYLAGKFPIFVALDSNHDMVGYVVCRVQDGVVWAESLYVRPDSRKRGIGSRLYAEAERLAEEHGSDTVYNWVHPTNELIIRFLKKRGYTVLNMIELCKKRPDEHITRKIKVNGFDFDY